MSDGSSFNLNGFDISSILNSSFRMPEFTMPEMPDFDPEDTIMGDIKRQIQEQNTLVSQQINILEDQNKLLSDNYMKLKDMYEKQVDSYVESKEDLRRSRNFNRWMMVIAIIAMLAAIAGPIATFLVV